MNRAFRRSYRARRARTRARLNTVAAHLHADVDIDAGEALLRRQNGHTRPHPYPLTAALAAVIDRTLPPQTPTGGDRRHPHPAPIAEPRRLDLGALIAAPRPGPAGRAAPAAL